MFKTLCFDTWGTLVDKYTLADVIEPYVFESHLAQKISEDWRFQQKWATFYTTAAQRMAPHPGLNEASFRWALALHHVELPESAIRDIMAQDYKLRAYPDVVAALKKLKGFGLTIKIVANPTRKMIEDGSRYAGTFPYIDEIISCSEEVKAFKPSPAAIQLGIDRAGCAKEEILWVAGHFWELYGADGLGLKTAWTNRARQPALGIGFTPTYETRTLLELADILAGEKQKGAHR